MHCVNIRQITFFNVLEGELDGLEFWEKVGSTVEIISVHFDFAADEEIREIGQHCCKLKDIVIRYQEISDLLISYGNSLNLQ